VPYGVDAALYRCRQVAPRGKFTVAFVGAFTQRKGALYLLRALHGLAPHVRLVIYTRAPIDPAFRAEFRNLDVEIKVGLSNAQLAEDIVRADVMALPSIAEGFGLAILEAMACGVPVICTHNTGGADLITNGQDGFVTPIRDVSAIIQIIEAGVSNRERFYEIGQKSRTLVERLTWASYRQNFAAAYRSLLP
jgi:glycosyltransferase involved in cell wall biosynthesis